MKVPCIPVVSSNVAAVGYDAPGWALVVEFKSGGIYRYPKIDAAVLWAMLEGSVGGYFARHLKAAPFEKLAAWPDAAERTWPDVWAAHDLPRIVPAASAADMPRWFGVFALVVLPSSFGDVAEYGSTVRKADAVGIMFPEVLAAARGRT